MYFVDANYKTVNRNLNPMHMRSKGYDTWFVCVCAVSVATQAATAFARSPKLRYHRDNYLT